MSQLVGIFGVSFAIWYVVTHPSTGFNGYIDPHAIVLLSIMPPSVMMLSHTLTDLLMGARLLISSIFSRQRSYQNDIIDQLTKCSALVRAEGLGSLVKVRGHIKYELLRDGISLIINDFRPEEIRHNLMARIDAKQSRMNVAANLFENMSKLCPGVGMIGTLIGLIHMLSNISDPSKLGGGMAMAMITTLYGLVLGTCLYGPWGEKVAIEAEKVLENDLMALEGVLNIKGKKSSIHLKDIVKTYGRGKDAPQQAKGA